MEDSNSEDETPALLMSVEVREHHRFTIPEPFRGIVCVDYPEDPAVFWSHETTMKIPILSNGWFSEPNYEMIHGVYSLYGAAVEVPRKIRGDDEIESDFSSGERLYLLSQREMMTDDPKSAYVLTERQAWKLLPDAELGGTDQDLREKVLKQVPGFLPTPR